MIIEMIFLIVITHQVLYKYLLLFQSLEYLIKDPWEEIKLWTSHRYYYIPDVEFAATPTTSASLGPTSSAASSETA